MMDYPAVYDRDLAVEQAGGSPELATDLFGMLARELPGVRDNLNTAFARADFDTLYRHIHKLHGSTLYTGVAALRAQVATLEIRLKKGQTAELETSVQNVIDEIDRVLEFARDGFAEVHC